MKSFLKKAALWLVDKAKSLLGLVKAVSVMLFNNAQPIYAAIIVTVMAIIKVHATSIALTVYSSLSLGMANVTLVGLAVLVLWSVHTLALALYKVVTSIVNSYHAAKAEQADSNEEPAEA